MGIGGEVKGAHRESGKRRKTTTEEGRGDGPVNTNGTLPKKDEKQAPCRRVGPPAKWGVLVSYLGEKMPKV